MDVLPGAFSPDSPTPGWIEARPSTLRVFSRGTPWLCSRRKSAPSAAGGRKEFPLRHHTGFDVPPLSHGETGSEIRCPLQLSFETLCTLCCPSLHGSLGTRVELNSCCPLGVCPVWALIAAVPTGWQHQSCDSSGSAAAPGAQTAAPGCEKGTQLQSLAVPSPEGQVREAQRAWPVSSCHVSSSVEC